MKSALLVELHSICLWRRASPSWSLVGEGVDSVQKGGGGEVRFLFFEPGALIWLVATTAGIVSSVLLRISTKYKALSFLFNVQPHLSQNTVHIYLTSHRHADKVHCKVGD